MTTSWNDIALTEKFLAGNMSTAEALFFEARMLTNPVLKRNVRLQKMIYRLVFHYHRKKLRGEVDEVHNNIFNDPDRSEFQQKIFQLFND
jgi:hypothetical protein